MKMASHSDPLIEPLSLWRVYMFRRRGTKDDELACFGHGETIIEGLLTNLTIKNHTAPQNLNNESPATLQSTTAMYIVLLCAPVVLSFPI